MVEISIVIPLYNEAESVAELVRQLVAALDAVGKSYEVLLVDDGSSDGTRFAIAEAGTAHSQVKGVYLARNYGQTTAMQAGFDHAQGRVVITLDGDLQNDPADIPAMLDKMEAEGADMVSGWRRDRKDDALRVWVSQVANRLIGRVTGVSIRDYGCSLKAYRRDKLEQIRIYGEMHRFMPAVLAEVGAKVVEMEVAHHPRQFGSSKYGFDRTFRVILDLLLVKFMQKYLHRPLHFFGWIGFSTFVPGFLAFVYLCFAWAFTDTSLAGRPLLLVAVFMMLAGISFIGQGLLAEVLVRVLLEGTTRRQYRLRSP